ncbi:hypothetical protein DPEC_G00178040 [Dallia pectoralis]|uniref:Uncharacterized protein n=1 Tax=Dallia pectoralis TaxID=75939 RepID=A0ACC2GF16_DALPE|nr:hypothetical protein DPEC_G00178040 [Dallia pectoralis]
MCLLKPSNVSSQQKKRAKLSGQQKRRLRTLSSISAASTASDQLLSSNSTPSPPSSAEDLLRPGSPPKFTSCQSPWPLSDHSSPRPQSRRSDAQGQIFTRSKKTVRKRVRYRAVVKLEPLGLPNIANSCFLIATLQCLLFLPMFFREILHQETLWRLCPSPTCSVLWQRCTSCQPGSGANLASKVKSMWKVMYALMEQEDAHEFLLDLLCQLKLEGRLLEDFVTGYICPVSHLEFVMASVLICTSCGRKTSSDQEYNHLSLNVSPGQTLMDSLALNFKCANPASLNRFGGTWMWTRWRCLCCFLPNMSISTLCRDTVPPMHCVIPEDHDDQALSQNGQANQSVLGTDRPSNDGVVSPYGQVIDDLLCRPDLSDQEPEEVQQTVTVVRKET